MIEKGYHYLTCLFPQDLPTPVIALVVALACFLPFLPSLRSSSSTTTSKPVEKTAEKTEKTEWTSFKWPPSQSPQQIPENTVNVCLPFILCFCQWWLLPGDQLSLLFLFQPTTTLLSPLMPHPVLPFPSPQPCWELWAVYKVMVWTLVWNAACDTEIIKINIFHYCVLVFSFASCSSFDELRYNGQIDISWIFDHIIEFGRTRRLELRNSSLLSSTIGIWHVTVVVHSVQASITWLMMLEPCFYHNFEAFEKWHLAGCSHTPDR